MASNLRSRGRGSSMSCRFSLITPIPPRRRDRRPRPAGSTSSTGRPRACPPPPGRRPAGQRSDLRRTPSRRRAGDDGRGRGPETRPMTTSPPPQPTNDTGAGATTAPIAHASLAALAGAAILAIRPRRRRRRAARPRAPSAPGCRRSSTARCAPPRRPSRAWRSTSAGRARAWSGAAGKASIDPARPMRAGDRFRAGSIMKPFVAAATLQLVEEGKLGSTTRCPPCSPRA